MEVREKTGDAEDFYSCPAVPREVSQSSGVISLPSANRLADLSLASDLTDSETGNEATVLNSSACGDHHDNNGEKHYEKDVTMPNSFSVKSSVLSNSQKLVDLRKNNQNINNRQSELSLITKERTGHDDSVYNGKSSKMFYSDMNVTDGEGLTDMPTSLDAVRAALQQHCNLLSDRHLLKDLLKSLDAKIEQKPVAALYIQPQCSGRNQEITLCQKVSLDNSFEEKNHKQLGFNPSVVSSLKSQSDNCASGANLNQGNKEISGIESLENPQIDLPDGLRTSGALKEDLHIPFFNSSLSEQEPPQKYPDKLASDPSGGRHVKFQSSTTCTQDPLVEIEVSECADSQEHQDSAQQSLQVLKKLAGLRWGLMGWEDVSSSPPTDSSSSLTFLHHLLSSLQALQLEKKHLKEELTVTLKKLNDLSEEAKTKQDMYDKRETRLIEADRQLGELQQAWAVAQVAEQQKAAKLMAHCHILKQENAFLKKEGQWLRNDVTELKAMTQQHMLMKTKILETEELLAANKKTTLEILEENNRLNLCLEENKNHLQELEKEKVPQLLGELEDEKKRAGRLEDSNQQLYQAKVCLEEDLHMLQEQHKLLLKRIVEEQEKKAEADQRKIILEDEVMGLSGKMVAMKTQLHLHYQSQVEDLVTRKSIALQEQLKILESNLEKTFEERLNDQVQSHKIACEMLQKRHEEEIRNIKSSNDTHLEKLHTEIEELRQENHQLHQQRKGVISAVSSVLGLEHQTSGDLSRRWNPAGPGSSRQAGANSLSMDGVKDGSFKTGSYPTIGKDIGNLPQLSLQSSSSSDTESTMFHDGKQTVRNVGGHSQCALPRDDISQNNYHKNQKKGLMASSNNNMNTKLEACVECQPPSAMHMKADNPQSQVTSCCTHSGKNNCNISGNDTLKLNLYENCKNQRSLDHKVSLFPSFTTKIRKASEILQANDLTDEDASYQDGEDMLFSPKEDEEMARILEQLRVQVSLSTHDPRSDAPTHDTSLVQDPASLPMCRLSQTSSLLSQ